MPTAVTQIAEWVREIDAEINELYEKEWSQARERRVDTLHAFKRRFLDILNAINASM